MVLAQPSLLGSYTLTLPTGRGKLALPTGIKKKTYAPHRKEGNIEKSYAPHIKEEGSFQSLQKGRQNYTPHSQVFYTVVLILATPPSHVARNWQSADDLGLTAGRLEGCQPVE